MTTAIALIARYWKVALLAALLALIAGQQIQIAKGKSSLTEERLGRSGERLAAATAARAQEAAYRAEEQRRATAQAQEITNAHTQATQAHADAAAAGGAALRLRQQVATLIAASRGAAGNTIPASGSPPAGDALDLLANVFGRADSRAGELAEYADRARIAGATCERLYDSLTVR